MFQWLRRHYGHTFCHFLLLLYLSSNFWCTILGKRALLGLRKRGSKRNVLLLFNLKRGSRSNSAYVDFMKRNGLALSVSRDQATWQTGPVFNKIALRWDRNSQFFSCFQTESRNVLTDIEKITSCSFKYFEDLVEFFGDLSVNIWIKLRSCCRSRKQECIVFMMKCLSWTKE